MCDTLYSAAMASAAAASAFAGTGAGPGSGVRVNLTNENGDIYGSAQPNEMAFDVAYSRLLSEKWSAAVAFRYIRSDLNNGQNGSGGIEMFPGNAFAADVATYYKTTVPMATGDANLAFGLNISNIGSKISYDQNETSLFLPANLRLGGSFEYPFDDYNKISIRSKPIPANSGYCIQ